MYEVLERSGIPTHDSRVITAIASFDDPTDHWQHKRMLQIWPVPIFDDNYVWILERKGSNRVAVVDPGDGEPVIKALSGLDLEIAAVLITHHHGDHVGGLAELIRRYHPPVYGSATESVAGVDHPLSDGDRVSLPELDLELEIVALPGHTSGHIGYSGAGSAFVGDTLFAGGCGRVFEGTMDQMHSSLSRLAGLPPETMAYCAHEYTLANLRFALAVEPKNDALAQRFEAAEAARAASQPTVPSTIGYELETNPFLRCDVASVHAAAESHAGHALTTPSEVFAVLRSWKDGWSG
jgi:hydroxyacylglutathione hydrolase